MANTFIPKRSTVAGKVPLPADLQIGELAVNLADKKIYTKDANSAVVLLNDMTGAGFPSGTAMLFAQTNAPTGWTKSTTHNDKALRVVSGTAGSGGSTSFSSTFAAARGSSSVTSSGSVGSTTLTESQIPSHRHVIDSTFDVWNTSAFIINDNSGDAIASTDNAGGGSNGTWRNDRYWTKYTGGSGSHTHSLSMNAHAHTLDIAVQYVDVIIATKD